MIGTAGWAQVAGVALLLVACGGKSSGKSGDGGEGGSSQGGTVGVAGSGGNADRCHAYDDDLATTVPVMILNQTQATIYLGDRMPSCGSTETPLFAVSDQAKGPLPQVNPCRLPCATPDFGGCTLLCAATSVTALGPNEAVFTSWSGLYGVDRQLPGSCGPSSSDSVLRCQQAQRIQPGTFVFSAVAGKSVTCGADAATCTTGCMLDGANGGCKYPNALVAGDALTAKTVIALDERFGVYEGADPGSGSGAAPGGSNQITTVNIVFTE